MKNLHFLEKIIFKVKIGFWDGNLVIGGKFKMKLYFRDKNVRIFLKRWLFNIKLKSNEVKSLIFVLQRELWNETLFSRRIVLLGNEKYILGIKCSSMKCTWNEILNLKGKEDEMVNLSWVMKINF